MSEPVPHTMRAVRLTAYAAEPTLEVKEVAVPFPAPGEVLVKVAATPVHLDDIVFVRGQHGLKRALPTTPGFEASGTVVSVGGGLVTRLLIGRRVAVSVSDEHDGTWAEYVVVQAGHCLPMWDGIDDEQASMLLIDPITALAMIDEVQERRHKGIVQTAPTSTVGRMIMRLGKRLDLPVVHVARGDEEVAAVTALGAEVVLDADHEEFDAQLRRATRSWQATALIDGVGGDLTGRLLAAMPDGAEAQVYGLEPGNRVSVDLSELVYRSKSVRGFCFLERARHQGARGMLAQLPRLRRRADDLRTEVATRVPLEDVPDVVARYEQHRAAGKVIVRPQMRAEES